MINLQEEFRQANDVKDKSLEAGTLALLLEAFYLHFWFKIFLEMTQFLINKNELDIGNCTIQRLVFW